MANATLQQAHEAFYAALNLIFKGDAAPMNELWSHADDVTYMGPQGGLLVGWAATAASWAEQAASITTSGVLRPEEVHMVETSNGLGVVVGYERGTVEIDGKTLPVDLRATSTYRFEGGSWKMIGHHTDRF